MKFVLATAAALVVAGSASAADMARKAPAAVDYVKVCDTYGAGFFYIPGSETCLKIGGYVRAQAVTSWGDVDSAYGSDRTMNSFGTQARLQINVDVRSNTGFGLLKAYGAINATAASGTWDDAGSKMSGASNKLELDEAYIQWGGLTAGLTGSKFNYFMGNQTHFIYGAIPHDDNVNQLAYTFGIGNGVSASISLEDPTFAGRAAIANGGFITESASPGDQVYGGLKMPDIVGNINISQAWGSAQVMGVLHNIYTTNTGTDPLDGVDKWGYAVGAGVTINLPSLGAGDSVSLQAVYGNGAMKYVSSYWTMADYDHGFGATGTGWAVYGGFAHNFSSTLAMNLDVGYLNHNAPGAVAGTDFAVWTAGAELVWSPVSNLSITAAVEYANRNYSVNDATSVDGDGWGAGLRIKRSF